MPELPDVEKFKRYFDSTGLHKTIESTQVGDPRALGNVSPHRVKKALRGHSFESTRRHGKFLFAGLDGGGWLMLHFGMTGTLKYFKHLRDKPDHTRILVNFANGYHLAYDCQRMLGEVDLADDPDAYVADRGLGPDAGRIDLEGFLSLMDGRRGKAKSALMNQHVIAGLGNVYADESLFRARIHPQASIERMSRERLARLYKAIQSVCDEALDRGVDARNFPRTWLIHHRGEGETCPRCGGTVRRVKINNRSTYYCPGCQGK
jgi:formamidopyrimidine-DNA glycosylase